MPELDMPFRYVAINGAGRKVRGAITAASQARAFEVLKRSGLSPLKLSSGASRSASGSDKLKLRDQDVESLFSDMAVLLKAGADIRSALSILADKSERRALNGAADALTVAIGGGVSVDHAVSAIIGEKRRVLSALIAAGQAGGDLSGGFEQGARLLAARRLIKEQMIAALSYPAFVLLSTIGAILLILFFVVPSLAPLVQDGGVKPPALLEGLLALSSFLQAYASLIAVVLVLSIASLIIAAGLGTLTRPLQRLALSGPWRKVGSGLVYGPFAVSLGGMLTAGASMTDALRLAVSTVAWREARDRLAPVVSMVRQGEILSTALGSVKGFPSPISRLVAVGEATGQLGPMLARSGALEEATALKQIEALGKLMGPVLIVVLGGLIGLLMAALLSGLTGLGESALQ